MVNRLDVEGVMLYLIIVLIGICLSCIYMFLEYADSKIDYDKRDIQYYFHMDNGFYVRVPYLIWQKHKKKCIEDSFADEITHEGKTYITTAVFKNQGHLQQTSELLPPLFYRDYMVALELKRKSPVKVIKNITKVIGNHNNIVIDQREINNITYEIDELLNYEIDDLDRQCIELFKYKLKENSVTDMDKSRVVEVLNKLSKCAPYASLASSIINLVKSL